MSSTEPRQAPYRARTISPAIWVWGARAGLGFTVLALLGMAASLIRLPRFVYISPIIPTSAKGLVEARSMNGLDFEVQGTLLAQGMASQAHSFDAEGQMQIVATDPTILRTRRGPDGEKVARTSSLVTRDPGRDRAGLLLLDGCTNRPGQRTGRTKQCVDPTIVDLPDGRQRMFWVRSDERVDPAFTEAENLFQSALGDGEGGWTVEDGVRLASPGAADPDVVRLPDGRWRMFYTSGKVVDEQSGSSSPGILSALSTDGHRFLAEPGVRVHRCSASASIVLASGQTRLYCHTRDVFTQRSPGTDPSAYIVSFISDDGLLFSREPGVRVGTRPGGRMIGAAAPSLRPHPDGGLSMVFTTVIEPPFPWNLKALKDEASVIREIEEDLRGRAKMGSSAPQDGAE